MRPIALLGTADTVVADTPESFDLETIGDGLTGVVVVVPGVNTSATCSHVPSK